MNNTFPEKVEIIDTTLRDGLQNEEHYVSLEAKLYIAEKLIDAGFKKLEVGSISHPKYVPQFNDVDELLLKLPHREDVEYTVLALTPKAIERVAALLDKGAKIDRVLTGQLAVSDTYAMKNMHRTHEQLFEEAERNVKLLHDMGIKTVCGNISAIWGCPYEGIIPLEKSYGFVDRMFNIGFDQIEHSDTGGISTPDRVKAYFEEIMKKYPDPQMHTCHIHDYRSAGITCYYAAMEAGVTTFETTLGAIGGQPANFFNDRPIAGIGEYSYICRRSGLVSTDDFSTMLNGMNVDTGLDLEKIYKLTQNLERILGHKVTSFSSFLVPNH